MAGWPILNWLTAEYVNNMQSHVFYCALFDGQLLNGPARSDESKVPSLSHSRSQGDRCAAAVTSRPHRSSLLSVSLSPERPLQRKKISCCNWKTERVSAAFAALSLGGEVW